MTVTSANPENPDSIFSSSVVYTVAMRLAVWGTGGLAAVLFWYAGATFGIPAIRGYAGSLLQGAAIANLVLVALAYFTVAAAASVVLGRFRTGIGVFAASFGLAAISVRGGTVSAVLRDLGANATYGLFLGETVVLAALTAGGLVLNRFLAPLPPIVEVNELPPKLGDRLLSVGLQAAITLVLVLVFGQTDDKGQALAAAGFAALLATLVADNMLPVGFTPMAVLAPFVAAGIGYAWALIGGSNAPTPANNLVTPLPLDYASFGVAGTMMGHWITHQWRVEAEEG